MTKHYKLAALAWSLAAGLALTRLLSGCITVHFDTLPVQLSWGGIAAKDGG